MNQANCVVSFNRALHVNVSLIALLRLMHLWIMGLAFVFSRTESFNKYYINSVAFPSDEAVSA